MYALLLIAYMLKEHRKNQDLDKTLRLPLHRHTPFSVTIFTMKSTLGECYRGNRLLCARVKHRIRGELVVHTLSHGGSGRFSFETPKESERISTLTRARII